MQRDGMPFVSHLVEQQQQHCRRLAHGKIIHVLRSVRVDMMKNGMFVLGWDALSNDFEGLIFSIFFKCYLTSRFAMTILLK